MAIIPAVYGRKLWLCRPLLASVFKALNVTHEEEADLMGLEIMARAGFDPYQSVALWRNMATVGGDKPPELLAKYTPDGTRIEALQQAMGNAVEAYTTPTRLIALDSCGEGRGYVTDATRLGWRWLLPIVYGRKLSDPCDAVLDERALRLLTLPYASFLGRLFTAINFPRSAEVGAILVSFIVPYLSGAITLINSLRP